MKRKRFIPNESPSVAGTAETDRDDITDTTIVHPAVAKDIWQHMLDCCTRYTQVRILLSRDTTTLLNSLHDMWILPFGPPKIIRTDQEG